MGKSSSVLLLKEKFRNHELSNNLSSSFKLKFSSKNIPDLVLTDCQPSLAIKIYETSQNSLNGILSGLKEEQKKFANSIGIIIVDTDDDKDDIFNQLNINLPAGSMRLFKANSYKDVISIIMIGYESMRDIPKFQKQIQFFKLEKESLTSSKTAKNIAYSGNYYKYKIYNIYIFI
jgi:hypothetical protein